MLNLYALNPVLHCNCIRDSQESLASGLAPLHFVLIIAFDPLSHDSALALDIPVPLLNGVCN